MTDTTTQKLITQLRMLQHLTHTEAQIAQTRQVQAATKPCAKNWPRTRPTRTNRAADRRRVA